MNTAQKKKFNSLYQRHVNALHRQGKAASTIDKTSRPVPSSSSSSSSAKGILVLTQVVLALLLQYSQGIGKRR